MRRRYIPGLDGIAGAIGGVRHMNDMTQGSDTMLSVVIPIYNEEQLLHELHRRTKEVMTTLEKRFGMKHEIIFVNDGSADRSFDLLTEIAQRDPATRVLNLSRNFGHQIAITAGIDHACGDAVVVMDGDLQDPPEVILGMVEKWKEGFKVVYGVRKKRSGESRFKLLTAALFYRVLRKLSDERIPLDTGDFRLMDASVVAAFKEIREENRFVRGLVTWIGFKQCPIEYERDARYAGRTKFTVRRMVKFALDGITSFSDKPLRASSQIGFAVTIIALLQAIWSIIGRIFMPETVQWGWTSLMVAILFLGGVQLISIGILGEYIARIFRETKRRPLYFVADRLNMPEESSPRDQAAAARR
jgi:glycosyltransferase involved in cell wall biosynthesis